MNQRVDRAEPLARGCGFSVPNVIGIVQELTLQVGEVDRIVVRDAEPPHACCSQIQRRRGSESTGTDDQDACALQSALTVLTDFIESDVPTVSDKLFRRERIVGGGNLGRRVRWYHAGRGLGRMIGEENPNILGRTSAVCESSPAATDGRAGANSVAHFGREFPAQGDRDLAIESRAIEPFREGGHRRDVDRGPVAFRQSLSD